MGVSGGRDSVALLHLLVGSGFDRLIVCHLDHRLRGRGSTGDRQFVERLAGRLGLPCETARRDVRALAREAQLSIEAAARQARLEFFAELSRKHRCNSVLLGHHADDRAETVLINLFRGSAGLVLPPSPSQIEVGGRRLTLIRPLYPVRRSEIDRYVEEHRLRYREDPSNQSAAHLRNRVRHELFPMLDEIFGRDSRALLTRAASIADEEDRLLDSQLDGLDLEARGHPGTLSTTHLRRLPVPLQRRAILRWLKSHSIPRLSFEKVEACLSLLDVANGPAKINLPGGHHARRQAKKLMIETSGGAG